jgi:hypothetical protein
MELTNRGKSCLELDKYAYRKPQKRIFVVNTKTIKRIKCQEMTTSKKL